MENVDKTIDALCEWIQEELKSKNVKSILPEVVSSLAELISARGRKLRN